MGEYEQGVKGTSVSLVSSVVDSQTFGPFDCSALSLSLSY